MNERIKELVVQAELMEIVDDVYIERNAWQPFVEKFAELIVRECAEIADIGYGSVHFGNGIASCQLLKHFGVKE